MSDTEDYDALRQKNIAERNAFLKDFFKEIKEDTEEIQKLESLRLSVVEKENKTPKSPKSATRKRRSRASKSPTFQGPRVQLAFKKKYNTRSKKRKLEDEGIDENDDELNDDNDILVSKKSSNIKVMFSWARPLQRDLDLMKDDYSEEEKESEGSDQELYIPKKRRSYRMSKSTYDPSSIPSPDEITQKMLDNIAVRASGKTYDAVNGSSCHQCRQKTKDTKTVCRSGECVGVRGQFCGPCLKGRYGESAKEALKDPHWVCPPCRGICNCSFCRTRNGQRPTGILAPLAKEEGYNSVKDYLDARDYED